MPHCFFVNKLDRPGSDFRGTLAALVDDVRDARRRRAPPDRRGGERSAATSTRRTARVRRRERQRRRRSRSRPNSRARSQEARTKLLEALGDFDDHLLEELLEGIEPPIEEVRTDLRDETARDEIVPGARRRGTGRHRPRAALLDVIENQFPAPTGDPNGTVRRAGLQDDDPSAIGQTLDRAHLRRNADRRRDARRHDARSQGPRGRPLQAARQETRAAARALGRRDRRDRAARRRPDRRHARGQRRHPACARSRRSPSRCSRSRSARRNGSTKRSSRRCSHGCSRKIRRSRSRAPSSRTSCSCSARAKCTSRRRRSASAASITSRWRRRRRRSRIARRSPTSTEQHARYKHQTGGHGQFADVVAAHRTARARPRRHLLASRSSAASCRGSSSRPSRRACAKRCCTGPIAKFPVVDLHVTLIDGQYHDVDSSEASFKTAASMAMRDALAEMRPGPARAAVHVEAIVPDDSASAILGDDHGETRARCSRSSRPSRAGSRSVIAVAPQSELTNYITELRTATQGLGTYSLAPRALRCRAAEGRADDARGGRRRIEARRPAIARRRPASRAARRSEPKTRRPRRGGRAIRGRMPACCASRSRPPPNTLNPLLASQHDRVDARRA